MTRTKVNPPEQKPHVPKWEHFRRDTSRTLDTLERSVKGIEDNTDELFKANDRAVGDIGEIREDLKTLREDVKEINRTLARILTILEQDP